jgi:hypothetical protein
MGLADLLFAPRIILYLMSLDSSYPLRGK